MSCCGSRRKQQFPVPPQLNTANNNLNSVPSGTTGGTLQQTVRFFVYDGQSALVVTGRITGRRYRFPHPGARIGVDIRDVPGLRGINLLRMT